MIQSNPSKFLLMFLISLSLSCASIHNGNFAKNEEGKISIQEGLSTSGIEATEYSSTHFLPLEFTIENSGNEWILIDEVKLSFKNIPTEVVYVPTGEDLTSWSQASSELASIRAKNAALIAGSILMVAGASTGKSVSSDPSSLSLIASGAGLTLAGLSTSGRIMENQVQVPANHLLAGSFSVPPGLFIKKWVVFYIKNPMDLPYFDQLNLELKIKNKPSVIFNIPFRTSLGSEFQSGHPEGHRKKQM